MPIGEIVGPLLGLCAVLGIFAAVGILVFLSVYVPLRLLGRVAGRGTENKVAIVLMGFLALLGIASIKGSKKR